MARTHIRRKLRTYHSLYGVNHHFAAIFRHVLRLEQAGFMSIPKMRVFQGLIRELQSQISHDVCDRMHSVEDEDLFTFGKVRIARDHYLNSDRPAFRQGSNADHNPEQQQTAV